MPEDRGDRGLRLLSDQFLGETCHFQQIVQNKFAHEIEGSFKRDHELGVQQTGVHCDCRA